MLQFYKPRPELQNFISRIMLNHSKLDLKDSVPTVPFPPQPEHCLFFYPYDKVTCHNYANGQLHELPSSILVGPQLTRVDLTMGHNMLVIMVGFHPGGMHRLLHLPMEEMLGRPIDATLLLGREVQFINEQLNGAQDYASMINIVQEYLVKRVASLKRSLPIEQVLIQILQNGKSFTIDQLAQQACISIRQLERQFKERTGMPPKVFSRLVRFSKAWMMREKNPCLSWLHIAHTCEYADQMHMIRDFKDFVGVTPGVLQADLEKSDLRLQGTSFI